MKTICAELPEAVLETLTGDLRRFVDDLEAGRLEFTPEQLALAAAVENRIREHPMSDEDALKGGLAFICFTPLGGD